MQRAHTHGIAHIARTTFAAALPVLLMAGAGLAQNNISPGTDAVSTPPPRLDAPSPDEEGRIPEAPVGHRQPRPQDLPPSVLREEGGANEAGSTWTGSWIRSCRSARVADGQVASASLR